MASNDTHVYASAQDGSDTPLEITASVVSLLTFAYALAAGLYPIAPLPTRGPVLNSCDNALTPTNVSFGH